MIFLPPTLIQTHTHEKAKSKHTHTLTHTSVLDDVRT